MDQGRTPVHSSTNLLNKIILSFKNVRQFWLWYRRLEKDFYLSNEIKENPLIFA